MASAAAALLLLTGCAASTPAQNVVAPERLSETPAATASASLDETKGPPRRKAASDTPLASPSPHKPAPQKSTKPSPLASPPRDVMASSVPVSINISYIGTHSGLLSLGLREDGSLEVPPDGPGAPAAWYNGSPTPGERGPAVLLGYVNAKGGGPGVFAYLRALQPGDLIRIMREVGSTAVSLLVVASISEGRH